MEPYKKDPICVIFAFCFFLLLVRALTLTIKKIFKPDVLTEKRFFLLFKDQKE